MRIALDFDSMLNDLGHVWVEWCRVRFNAPDLQITDIAHWDYKLNRFGREAFDFICAHSYDHVIKPLPGAVAFVEALQDAVGAENVLVCTTSLNGTDDSKDRNIARYFDIPKRRVIHVSPKESKAPHTVGTTLVDDYGKNILEHVEANRMPGIVFNYRGEYPWSGLGHYEADRVATAQAQGLVKVCRSYDEVLNTILERI
jgi:hypothetical protein